MDSSMRRTVHQLSPHLAPLWEVLHRRLSTGRPVQRVKVGPLDLRQQEALADLFGLPRLPGEYRNVGLAELDTVLRAATGSDSRAVVTKLIGPIGDLAAERQWAKRERNELWEWLSDHEVVRSQPALRDWAEAMRRTGLIGGSAERTRVELARALSVLRVLPSAGTPLPIFAENLLADPHDLDDGTRLHSMVVRALTALFDCPAPQDATELRALWERAGVADDELSSTVLVAGRPTGAGSVAGQLLGLCADAGIAGVLTLQQLRAAGRVEVAADVVWVVENPSVLAMALKRFGARCPPLVCISGWPSSAGVRLLEMLTQAGAELRYHGDFDGEGLRIAANVVARLGASPWRMSSADYLQAAGGGPPVGRVTAVPWDDDLAGHLQRHGRAVPEERVVEFLLADIAP
ncbi:TIGR02679 family protein [Nocardia goodfellowii]